MSRMLTLEVSRSPVGCYVYLAAGPGTRAREADGLVVTMHPTPVDTLLGEHR